MPPSLRCGIVVKPQAPRPGRPECDARRLKLGPAACHIHECRPLAQLALCFSAAAACRHSTPPAATSLIFRPYFARYAKTKSKPQAPNVESACSSCRTAASVSLGGHGCVVRTSYTVSNRACSGRGEARHPKGRSRVQPSSSRQTAAQQPRGYGGFVRRMTHQDCANPEDDGAAELAA